MLCRDQPFSLDRTLSCGQAFRWDRFPDGSWTGTVGDQVIRCRQKGRVFSYSGTDEEFVTRYFSLDLDMGEILESIDADPFIHTAIEECRGLRIVRQPPWECLCSYIVATNSNIPTIRRRIAAIARHFGCRIGTAECPSFSFPSPEGIFCREQSDLTECMLGYRMPYVYISAGQAASNPDWADTVASLPYNEAQKELMKFSGIGPKAADCVLLFAFQKFESFPVDVWIRRIMREQYLPGLPVDAPLTKKEYDAIRAFADSHFGKYCGIAQEYLFAAREGA